MDSDLKKYIGNNADQGDVVFLSSLASRHTSFLFFYFTCSLNALKNCSISLFSDCRPVFQLPFGTFREAVQVPFGVQT